MQTECRREGIDGGLACRRCMAVAWCEDSILGLGGGFELWMNSHDGCRDFGTGLQFWLCVESEGLGRSLGEARRGVLWRGIRIKKVRTCVMVWL